MPGFLCGYVPVLFGAFWRAAAHFLQNVVGKFFRGGRREVSGLCAWWRAESHFLDDLLHKYFGAAA